MFFIYSSLTLVPEPSAGLLLGFGVAGLAALRRRPLTAAASRAA